MPSPRYVAEHALMPSFLREHGARAVLDAIANDDRDFFIPVWMAAGFRFTPRLVCHDRGDCRVGVLTLPAPREDTEAYLAGIVGKTSDPSYLRYFLLEASSPLFGDEPGAMLCEWSGATHLNHGSGPRFTGDFDTDIYAFADRLLAVCECGPE